LCRRRRITFALDETLTEVEINPRLVVIRLMEFVNRSELMRPIGEPVGQLGQTSRSVLTVSIGTGATVLMGFNLGWCEKRRRRGVRGGRNGVRVG
jgi:hypothetical protein